jgi:UDP-N-acetylmuramoylalanine--D-glutamate ligase
VQPILTESNRPKRVSILGAGRSGIAAAKIFAELGSPVFISDTMNKERLDFALATNGCAHMEHEAEGHSRRVLEADVIVLSPGIPSDIPILRQARKRAIAVWSEIELGFRLSRAPWLAVTGSTGKSTTVSLLGAILTAAGKQHVVAGNIGLAVSNVVSGIPQQGFVVAEVSSFQLENIDAFKPQAAAVLNLLKNHLDRYDSEEAYYNAKKEIARNMTRDDTLVLNAGDERLCTWGEEMKSRTNILYYGRCVEGFACVWHLDGNMYCRRGASNERLLDLRVMKLQGSHNYDNACAAAALALAGRIDTGAVAAGLSEFGGLPHRLEFVGEIDGVRFYNDSKATTAESVVAAVSAFAANVHLIAGGRDKGCDFSMAREAIKNHARSVTLIGEAAERISAEWRGLTDIRIVDSLQEAVHAAHAIAREGDVVVLSPGCSSYDMFRDFEERGDIFKEIVNRLEPKGHHHA